MTPQERIIFKMAVGSHYVRLLRAIKDSKRSREIVMEYVRGTIDQENGVSPQWRREALELAEKVCSAKSQLYPENTNGSS